MPKRATPAGPLRVSVVTNMWPTVADPSAGVFVQREVEALRRLSGIDVDVIHVATTLSRWCYLTSWPRVEKRLRRHEPHVVHFHYGLSQLLSPCWKGPSVVTFHGSDLRIRWQRTASLTTMRLHQRRAAIVVAGEMLAHLPISVRAGHSVRVVPCGVDTSLFRPMDKETARSRLGLSPRGCVLMFPASPRRETKDYPLFERVVERVRRRLGTDVTVLKLDGVVPEVAAARYAAADVVVLTSRHEGSPVVVKEALACHRPVVSVAVGDVGRYCRGCLPCAVCDSRDPEELAALVVEAIGMNGWPNDPADLPTVETEVAAVLDAYRSVAREWRTISSRDALDG